MDASARAEERELVPSRQVRLPVVRKLRLCRGPRLPGAIARERPPYAVRERVEEELRHVVEPLVHALDVRDEHVLPDAAPEPRGGEVRRDEDERGHVPPARVGHHADVLEAVALLDEADRLLYPPPGQVALDDLPQGLVGAVGPVLPLLLQLLVDGEVREQHHGLLPETLDDHEPQLLVAPRQLDRHDAEVDLAPRLLSVGVEADDGLVAHDALACQPCVGLRAFPANEVAFVHARYELAVVVQVVVVERGPVPAPVVHAYSLAVGGPVYRAQDVQHLLVLALVPGGVRRPELEREGHGLPRSGLAGHRHAAVVAPRLDDVVLRGPARVPDEREVLHLAGVRLADVRRVDDDQRVPVDEPLRVVHHGVLQVLCESLRLEVSAEAVLHVAVPALRVDGARDVGEYRVARRLYPVHHVAYELVLRLRKTVKHFHHEIVELGSRFPRDYAIIHSAVLSFVCFFGNGYYTRTDGETDSVFVVRLGLGRSGGGRKSPRRPDASPMRVSASGAFRSAASIRNVERPQGRSRRVLRGELAPVAGLARKQSQKRASARDWRAQEPRPRR